MVLLEMLMVVVAVTGTPVGATVDVEYDKGSFATIATNHDRDTAKLAAFSRMSRRAWTMCLPKNSSSMVFRRLPALLKQVLNRELSDRCSESIHKSMEKRLKHLGEVGMQLC